MRSIAPRQRRSELRWPVAPQRRVRACCTQSLSGAGWLGRAGRLQILYLPAGSELDGQTATKVATRVATHYRRWLWPSHRAVLVTHLVAGTKLAGALYRIRDPLGPDRVGPALP